ncbi:MAG: glutamine-hydrolyzing GMP synthase, partial [Rhodocyclaceae bacterium]|nr:glutamine-hydrolyzing GMP synthase [Rhodocyclaceae bacterium]
MHKKILILDFGAQYSQLIARRVREQQVYCELHPYDVSEAFIREFDPVGIILSGGPNSVYEEEAYRASQAVFELGIPVLGICYGMQALTHALGGMVAPAQAREYGSAKITHIEANPLFAGLQPPLQVWMSHGDRIEQPPRGFTPLAASDNSPYAAMGNVGRGLYGVQFHPEVAHTPQGVDILRNFIFDVCGCQPKWTPASFIEDSIERIRAQVGGERVLLGLSGGVDSAVVGALLQRAIG